MNSSKEVCVYHIEHEPVLLTFEEIYFCIIANQIHQLRHMQECSFYFHGSILGMYPNECQFYQKGLDTTNLKKIPMSTKNSLKNHCDHFKYKNSRIFLIHEIQQQNSLEKIFST